MIKELRALIGDDSRVVAGADIEAKFLTDTLGRLKASADALVFALTTDEVSRVMRYAYETELMKRDEIAFHRKQLQEWERTRF